MTDELMSQFAQIQNYAAALHGLLAATQTRAPQRSEWVVPTEVLPVPLPATSIKGDEFQIIANLDEAAEGAECSCSASDDHLSCTPTSALDNA